MSNNNKKYNPYDTHDPQKDGASEAAKTEEVKADEAKTVEAKAETNKNETFTSRTLKAINAMQNPAKAEKIANRLLRKKGN